jgi:hypothetical protein
VLLSSDLESFGNIPSATDHLRSSLIDPKLLECSCPCFLSPLSYCLTPLLFTQRFQVIQVLEGNAKPGQDHTRIASTRSSADQTNPIDFPCFYHDVRICRANWRQ